MIGTTLLCFLIVAHIMFIWGNSLQSREASAQKSQRVFEVVSATLEPILGEGVVTVHLVRKLAHVAEFGLLGVGLCLLLVVRRRVMWQAVTNILFVSFFVAVVDETLQILSRRGPLVSDIWIDVAGAAGGILIALCIRKIGLVIRIHREGSIAASGLSRSELGNKKTV